MPYINANERGKFHGIADQLIQLFVDDFPFYERLTYFCYEVLTSVSPCMTYDYHVNLHHDDKINDIDNLVQETVGLISVNKNIYTTTAGEFNYLMSRVLWGMVGDAPGVPLANYGKRSLINGALQSVLLRFQKNQNFDDVFVLGVMNDIITEMDRRKTSVYEDGKMKENGDVWT